MRRKTLILVGSIGLILLVALPLLLACDIGVRIAPAPTPAPKPAPAPATEKVIKWRMQSAHSAGYKWETITKRFVERVNKASGGRLQIEPYPGGALVPTLNALEAVGKGVVDVAQTAPVYWRAVMPAGDLLFGVPYSLGDNPLEYEYMWWELGMVEVARQQYANHNTFFVGPIFGGPYSGMSTKPIRTLSDLAGLKLRSFGLTGDLYKAFGASIVSVPVQEMYTAMSMRTIDAAHWGSPTEFYSFKIHEVAKYFLLPPVVGALPNDLFVNMDKWKALAPDLQEIVTLATKTASAETAAFTHTLDSLDVDNMKKTGVAFSKLSDSDIILLRKKATELADEKAKSDPAAAKAAEIVKKAMSTFGSPW